MTMKNVSHKKKWNMGTVRVHMQPPTIILIKIKSNEKLDKRFVKIKLCRDSTSEKSDLCEFKISFFGNGEPKFVVVVCSKL